MWTAVGVGSVDMLCSGLTLGPGYRRKLVDGLLTGTHDVSESHYQLLRAFLPERVLNNVNQALEDGNYLTHEFGDLCLVFGFDD